MASPKTLREIIEAHPDWADRPIGIYTDGGSYDYVGGAGDCYEGLHCPFEDAFTHQLPTDSACKNKRDCATCKYAVKVVVFAGN
jgi:hypothetical protein